jgi:serine protease AprX
MALNKKFTFSILFAFIFSLYQNNYAQTFKYFVSFKNKTGTPYSISTPGAYLSPKAIARRTNQGIAINQTDLPVTPSYVTQVDAVPTTTVLYRSKWLNGVMVLASPAAITTINSYTFVNSSLKANKVKVTLPYKNTTPASPSDAKIAQTASYNYGPSYWQQKMIQADCLHNQGYRGQGMTIAIMDIGFYDIQNNPVFDSLFIENRLLGTRDFVNGDTLVFEDASELHGVMCLSTMAGNKPGTIVGTAPKAKYWLLKTEDGYSESITEEYNWVRAVEFADSVGADITTTSLIYNQFDGGLNDHVYATDLNGKTAPMSIAANMAARKGMIVLNGAGNDGGNAWYYVDVPADADSIIAVGAVDSLGAHAGFSSYGPSSDGRIKPDLSTRGANAYVCSAGGSCFYGNGTSFATPILAGATACLWQYKNFAKNMQIISAMKNTASNSSTPNNSIGWGIPQMCNAATLLGSVGVKEIESNDDIFIFPNPVKDELNIALNSKLSFPVLVKIIDVLGKEVFSQQYNPTSKISIKEVSKLESGFYTVNIISNEKNSSKKFSKIN